MSLDIQDFSKIENTTFHSGYPGQKVCQLGIGGPLALFGEVFSADALKKVLAVCLKKNYPYRVISEGTNIFFSDKGFRGVVIRFTDSIAQFNPNEGLVEAAGGANLKELISRCCRNGLKGFEPLYGIPGSVGGAVFGNAGAYGTAINDLLTQARVLMPDLSIAQLSNRDLEFEYRGSRLKKKGGILLRAEFKLAAGDPEQLTKECRRIMELRRQKHPAPDIKTAGSYFKNIKNLGQKKEDVIPAGRLLEEVGAKGFAVNDAAVFEKHANIFVNLGHAAAEDLLELEKILKERVYQKHGITLQREVMYIQ